MKLRMRSAGAILLLAGLSACDIPTGMPRWDTTWITPGEEVSVSVAELLPAGLSVNADTSAFVLQLDTVTGGFQLSDFCPACPSSPTIPVPKPAFTGSETIGVPLPDEVESVDITSGMVIIELTNNFDFDPIRPSASARGDVTLELRSGATLVSSLVIDGNQRALAPGTTLRDTMNFAAATVQDSLTLEVTLDSPAGDNTTMSANDGFEVEVWSPSIEVAEATVSITSQAIESEETELDLSDVDLGDRIQDGTIFLDIVNPFGVTGTLNITVTPETGAPIVKNVNLSAGNTTVQVDFSEEEIERLIGETSTMSVTGTVNGGNVTVQPDDEIGVTARLRVTVEIGGESGDEDEG